MEKLIFNTLEEFKQIEGKELPNGSWYTVTQQMINDFANATLDKQWIHVDEKRAEKESPFKSTVAHGFMSVAMISRMLEEAFAVKSVKMGLNYGLNKVRFPNPVPVNSELRMLSSVKLIEELPNNGVKVTFSCTIEIKGQEKPACVAEFLAALFE
ncbi:MULTISPECIES: MaoC family dehydratase [Tenacibaculum]|uniref:MaoC family dehydratase n=1 Tax=Tenacibaculum TaxID=104267 RepID=UPI001F0B407E|nr:MULTISPECIES: MaoC family dehydratase [Tenacibaculum]MCH3882148.1 MaoC family dehydratase [Tenacibaculum aquimarinum]MCH3885162.1 MaoC family dehydratase [Tenacibaculum aquimarinum]MDO6599788.1 MaoC family dehydratase [Tenacibaculum sp. 1_MG-2023]